MLLRLFKQSSYLFIAQVIIKVSAFFYTLFLARHLGVEDFGLYTLALSYFALASIVSELGLNRYLIREAAINRDRSLEIVLGVALLRFTIAAVVFSLFAIGISITDPDKFRRCLILIALVAVIPNTLSLTLDSAYIALSKIHWSGMGLVVSTLGNIFLGVYLLNQGFGVFGVVTAVVLSQFIYLLFLIVLPNIKSLKFSQIFLKKKILDDPKFYREIIVGTLPLGILGVLGLLYFRVDTFFISYMRGSYELGIYGAAFKFLEAVIVIPATVSIPMFPMLANLGTSDPKKIYRLYVKASGILFVISIFASIGFSFVLPVIIRDYLPQYIESIDVVRILSFSLPFFFLTSAQSVLLLSQKRFLKPLIWISVVVLIFNAFLNFLFVPRYGYIASAWVTVLSEILVFLMFLYVILRDFRRNRQISF